MAPYQRVLVWLDGVCIRNQGPYYVLPRVHYRTGHLRSLDGNVGTDVAERPS